MSNQQVKSLIFDMDGVLWRGQEPLADLEDVYKKLLEKRYSYAFATNNSTRHVDQYVQKLNEHGIPAIPDQIFTSGNVTAETLKQRHPNGGNVYLIGGQGLHRTMEDYGFTHTEENPLAVICGLDIEVTYNKICQAVLLIRSGVPFIGTNPDRTFPIPEGLAPGAGSLLAAIEAATDAKPEIIGKPQPTMFQNAMHHLGTSPQETLVVGDRRETDIAGGQAAGCQTALILTGVTTEREAKAWRPAPDLIVSSLYQLLQNL
ncbi:HAD-IIA family hydrolase [Chloroflexota bacterium]